MSNTWSQDKYVQTWLNSKSPKSVKNYTGVFPKWLDFIKLTPTEQIEKRLKDLRSVDKPTREYFEQKLVEYKKELYKHYDTESSIRMHLTAVRSFFSGNRLALNLSREDVKIEVANKVINKGWIPTNEEIRVAYNMADLRDRALLLVLYQSGFSEKDVEALNIEDLNDIYNHEGHLYISKRREKTNAVQSTCISSESVHDIQLMLKERENPKEGALFMSNKNERLTVRFINTAMKKIFSKAYPKKHFKTKSLRDSYNSALLRANLTAEIKDLLFGHKRSGAKSHYSYDETTIKEAYEKAFKCLSVNGGTQHRKQLEHIEQTVTTLSELVTTQQITINNLKKDKDRLEKKFEDAEKTVKEFGEMLKRAIKEDMLKKPLESRVIKDKHKRAFEKKN